MSVESLFDEINAAMQVLSLKNKDDKLFADLCANVAELLQANISTSIDQYIQEKVDNVLIDQAVQTKVDRFLEDNVDRKVKELLDEKQTKETQTSIQNKLDEHSKTIKDTQQQINENKEELKTLKTSLNDFQIRFDGNIATELQKEEVKSKEASVLHKRVDKLEVRADNTEQYTRRETIEFHRIPVESTRHRKEDPTNMIINFCARHLDIHMTRADISVCHRQPIEEERRRAGRNYIPAIYCRFTRRTLMLLCLEKRHLLRNVRNRFGQRMFLRENLTLERRQLLDRVENELTSFEQIWVKDWKIFARKDKNTRPIRIHSELALEKLLKEQSENPSTTRPYSTIERRLRRDYGSERSPRNLRGESTQPSNNGWPDLSEQTGQGHFDWFDGNFLPGILPHRRYNSRSFSNSRNY